MVMGAARGWAGVVGATLVFGAEVMTQAPSINQRKTTAQALIAGSRNLYDGSYALTGTSGVCGEIPKEASLTGEAVFVVEFPSDGTGNGNIVSRRSSSP